MERKQFTFYDSFYRGISQIKNKAARCDAYEAIIRYALFEEEPKLDKLPSGAASAFEFAKPVLYAAKLKAEAGRKGGAASKQEANASKPEARGNRKQEKEQEQDKEQEQMLRVNARACALASPSVKEVAAYITEKGYSVDPEAFVAFYSSKGWKIGGEPMEDWKAAVTAWEKRDKAQPSKTKSAYQRQQEMFQRHGQPLSPMLRQAASELIQEQGGGDEDGE